MTVLLFAYPFGSAPICCVFGRHEGLSTKGKRLNLVERSRTGIVRVPVSVQCVANSSTAFNLLVSDHDVENNNIAPRSADYQLPIWQFDYIQSLKSKYTGKECVTRISKLMEDVKVMLDVANPLASR